jgi:hypothetical protein
MLRRMSCGVAAFGLILSVGPSAQAQDPGDDPSAEAQAQIDATEAASLQTSVYEAENAKLGGFVVSSEFGKNPSVIGWSVAAHRKGVNMSYAKGGTITWNNVDGGAGGTATLEFQYANGGHSDRFMRLEVNGAVVAGAVRFVTSRPRLGGFNSWWGKAALTIASVQAHLNPGPSNTVKLVCTQSLAPHVDFLRVTAEP